MAVSRACTILWGTGIVFVILPHFSLGLLSDYKICGDSECESLMSRVQAIRDHHGADCRFLSFRRGDTIFVYHKLTGKREDLWAGSIDKQFGYFPKEAVQEELVYAAMEKVVETQKSDFFCMNEFGYPIDSSHLDADADADADQKNQESETTQTSPYPDDTSAESPSTSVDPSAESPVSAQEADGTSAEEDENRSAGDGGDGTLEGARETPAALREQGGSAPSSWLGSSVTGWLGLAKEEEAGSLAEGGEKDEGTEMRAEASVASSVTGWLGLGGEGKPDDAVKSREEDTENADSFTSTMTGWLGFGGETKTAEKERDVEGEDDEEPAERFRSRRMSLDLEGSQLHEEEKKETGTLDWLGSGLSSTLGFGLTNQESGHEATPEREAKETIQEEEEQPASGSWFDVGIGDILGFRKDKKEVDESAGSGFKETEEDKTIKHPAGSENVDTSQSQRALTEEVGTETGNESEVEEMPKDQNVPPEIRVNADTNNNDIGTSDSSKDRVSPEDAASEVHLEDISPQTDLEKMRHTEGGMSSMLNSSKEEEEDNVSDDRKKEKSAEMEGEDHQMPKLIESEADVNNREAGGDKSKTASGNDQDFLTQSGINFGTNSSSVDLNLNSVEQSVGEVEEDKTEDAVEEGAGIPNQTDNTQESTDAVRIGASSHEGEGNDAETDVLHPEISTTRTDDSAEQSQGGGESGGKSQPLLLSGTAEERNEPVSNEDEPLPSHSVETNDDISDSLAMIDSTETETLQGEIGQEVEAGQGSSQEFESSRSANKSTDSTYEGASEEDRRTLSTNKSATQMENSADQDSVSPQSQQGSTQSVGDAHKLKEAVKETERDSDKNNLQPVQSETIELEKYILNERGLKSAIGSGTETQTEEVESKEKEMQGEETQQEVKEIKEEEKQQAVKEIKEVGKQREMKEIKEVGKQKEVEEIMKEGKQGEEKDKKGDEKQKEGEKIKEVEKQQDVNEIKEEGKQGEEKEKKEDEKQKEGEKIKEVEKQQEVKEIKEEGKQGEEKEKKEDEKQKEGEKIKEEEKQQEVNEIKEEGKQGEEKEKKEDEKQKEGEKIKEVEKQQEVKEIKEEGKQGEEKEKKEDEKQKEGEKIKEVEKQQEVKEIKEVGKQKVVEEIMKEGKQGEEKEKKEEGKQQEVKEVKEDEKQKEGEKIKEEGKQGEEKEKKEDEKQKEGEKIKEVEKQQEVKEIKEVGKQKVVEEIMKEGKQGEEKEKKEEGKQQEVKEVKEDEKQKEVEKIKEEDKQEGMEELKQKQGEKEHSNGEEKKDEMEEMNKQEELKGVEKQDEVKELKEEGKHQRIEELKEEKEEVEELKEAEEREELKEVEGVKKQETKEGEEKQAQSNFEEEMENSLHSLPRAKKHKDSPEPESDRKETQDENSSDSVFSKTSTQTEKSRTENPQMEEEEREEEKVRGEMKEEVEEMENVERLRRNKEEDMTLKCSNELCSEDRFVRDRDGNHPANMLSSIEEGAMETGQQNPLADNDQILADRTGVIQPVPVEGVEKGEDGIQVEEEKEEKRDDGAMADEGKNNCLPHSGESANPLSLGQTTENTEEDQLHSSEAHNTEVEDSETIRKGVSPRKETEQVHSDHKIVTEEHTDMEEREMNGKHGDFRTDGGMEVPVLSVDPVESPAVISEQTAPSDGHDIGTGEPGSGGAFGLFKSTFSFFKSPVTETEGSKESAQSLGSDTGETSKVEASLPPEQEVDSSTDLSQVYVKDLQPQPSPPVTSPPSPTKTRSHPNESPLQAKTLTEHYKSLLAHMSADEATVLTELFGRHKLQFLDYMLGSTAGTTTDDPNGDDSILLDIERLLGHHREALVAPSVRLADAPREDKEKTRTLFALQKLETLLARVRETFSTAGPSCVGESCSTQSEDKETPGEEDSSVGLDSNTPRDEWVGLDKDKDGPLSGGTAKERVTEDEERGEEGKTRVMSQILDFAHQIGEDSTTHVHAARELLIWLTVQVVSSLPDDIRPGPDLYGVPWEPVIVSGVVGLVTMLLFTCRCYSSVKSRLYRSKERRMAEQVAQLLDEKCKVLETLSKCQQEYDDLESTLRDSGVLAQTQKTEHLEVKARQLGHAKRELDRDLEQLKDQLDQQRDQRIEQERRIALLEESMKTTEEETRDLQSQDEQAHTTLKVFSMNSDRLQRNLETAGEENALLQESNAQLRQQVEGWAERVSELEAEMSRCEVAHSAMLQDVANKDERLTSLTDRLLRMKAWDSNLEEEEGEEGGEKETSNGRAEANGKGDVMDTQGHLQKVQKLIYAAKLNADLKAVDEDKDRLFAKLNDEVKAKEDLQVSIKELVNEKLSLQSDSGQYEDQVQRLQQKLQIMTEMYQENELKLHRLLTVEEKERMQKQEKLSKADRNIALAMEELSNYRQRAREMEEELEKTKQSYQTQISAHEKKAHNNWLAARAADRELTDIRRENGLFRQKLTDTQFKLEALDKDPYALDSLARPLPFRAERSPYGPSPLGRPASETRAFLSPPTLMDGPPGRLSPRVSRGPVEPPGGQGELDRSGGPHSDSGSISPTWERDRRGPPPGPPGPPGPLGPPGYMFPEPGGPMYRRPPLGALGPLHPRGPPHPADMADGSYRENSHGPGELEHRESGPGDRRTPPEADPRIGGAPPPGPPMGPMGPMGGPFPRRAPYGPLPPDFYPSRGPVGPPMMPMWAPPPPGMMLPPRFPPSGPLAPRPHYAPPMRPPLLDGHPHPSMGPLPPQQSVPSPPHSQSPEEPSPEDAI
ncbi:cTAGE family member 5 isoform X2 [Cebidichthys violaceus]|uniref:cTAGE family member 5 isoform X2 n=1 Tax=Cebidichthys violaceus TaxID=271503 RepID=UPI0035CC99DB